MESLRIISVNIEMDRHLDSVRVFLEKENPDVVCVQEVYEPDLRAFAEHFGMEYVFGQMNVMGRGDRLNPPFFPYGIGMLYRLPAQNIQRAYYQGDSKTVKERIYNGNSREDHHLLLCAMFQKGWVKFQIGTTHFTWTSDGKADDLQRENLQKMLAILRNTQEIVLCGDFNAPRGKEIFDEMAKYYHDNIPTQYTTSIDVNLHRLGEKLRGEPLMVDGLFTTSGYKCSNVRLQEGVSDHMAIVAEISRIQI